MARKPLIDPNSLNQGGSTPLSTISRIVQRDREASGRSNPSDEAQVTAPTPQSEPANGLTGEPANPLTSEPVIQTDGSPVNQKATEAPSEKAPDLVPSPDPEVPAKAKPKKASETTPRASARRQEAEERVEQMGKSPMKQIGPRIPGEWDEWLEDYVYARRKTGLQKQDIIRDLVRGFIVSEIAREEEEA